MLLLPCFSSFCSSFWAGCEIGLDLPVFKAAGGLVLPSGASPAGRTWEENGRRQAEVSAALICVKLCFLYE